MLRNRASFDGSTLGLKEKGRELREMATLEGKGCHKCGKCGTNNKGRKRASGIVNCGVLSEGNKFRSISTGEEFNIRQNINCNSTNIIYLVTSMMITDTDNDQLNY